MQKGVSQELVLFGKIVRKARREKTWSQTELAAKVDLDLRTVQRIERGESNITFTNFQALVYVLNIDPAPIWKKS
jgi:ribosome-binding protein aMBF1 (putative translation factor)